jgi:hypothetical protein
MSKISNSGNQDRPVVDHVHPLVYTAVIGLASWFVVSAVVGFGSDGNAISCSSLWARSS